MGSNSILQNKGIAETPENGVHHRTGTWVLTRQPADDNLKENFQGTDAFSRSEDRLSAFEEAYDSIEEHLDTLENLE